MNGSRVREIQNLVYKPVEGNFTKCQLLAVLLENVFFFFWCWFSYLFKSNKLEEYYFPSCVVPVCCCGGSLTCCPVVECNFVQSSLSKLTAADWLGKSENKWECCVVCLLWSPDTLPLKDDLCDDRLLCSSTVCTWASCFQLWMDLLYWLWIIWTFCNSYDYYAKWCIDTNAEVSVRNFLRDLIVESNWMAIFS